MRNSDKEKSAGFSLKRWVDSTGGYLALAAASFVLCGWGYEAARRWVDGLPVGDGTLTAPFLPNFLGALRVALPVFFVVLALLTAFRIRTGARPLHRANLRPAALARSPAARPPDRPRSPPPPRDVLAQGVNYGLLRRMEWRRFEIVCAEYLRCINYEVLESGFGPRDGVDLEIYLPGESTLMCVARCFTTSRPVDLKPLRAFHAAVQRRGVVEAMAFSVCGFTRRAERYAASHHIALVGGEALCAQIARLDPELKTAMLKVATSGNYSTPHCPACGVRLVLRRHRGAVPGRKEFWGCVNHPHCKVTLPFR